MALRIIVANYIAVGANTISKPVWLFPTLRPKEALKLPVPAKAGVAPIFQPCTASLPATQTARTRAACPWGDTSSGPISRPRAPFSDAGGRLCLSPKRDGLWTCDERSSPAAYSPMSPSATPYSDDENIKVVRLYVSR